MRHEKVRVRVKYHPDTLRCVLSVLDSTRNDSHLYDRLAAVAAECFPSIRREDMTSDICGKGRARIHFRASSGESVVPIEELSRGQNRNLCIALV